MDLLDSSALEFWECVAEWGFIAVIVGVVGEGAEICAKLFWNDHFKKYEKRYEYASAICWIVLVLGLAVEWMGTHQAQIRAKAINANLNLLAETAKKEAEGAHLETEKLKAVLAWRQLSPWNREHFKTVAAELPKGRVMIESTATNSEAANFASQIADMLRASGYDVVENFGSWSNQGKPVTGVRVLVKDTKSAPQYAIGLQKALDEIDIRASAAPDERAQDVIVLLVGNKP